MSNGTAAAVITFLLLAYRLLVIGGCAYAVFGLGHSGWWFLLAILIAMGADIEDGKVRK